MPETSNFGLAWVETGFSPVSLNLCGLTKVRTLIQSIGLRAVCRHLREGSQVSNARPGAPHHPIQEVLTQTL
jgi:hypothetical protein